MLARFIKTLLDILFQFSAVAKETAASTARIDVSL
jgi:hypothetical protein